jgi:poly-gamma-glutamate synthesis protein (capsule biosynthesis protein)
MKDMGINLVNHANNHTFDGGVNGMISTDKALDAAGIVHAGTGRNLQEARGAQFLNTAKGRVGLIGMFSVDDSSNYGPAYSRTEATARNGNLGGAPGLNPLHLTTYHVVSPEQLQSLKQIAAAAYHEGARAARAAPGAGPERAKFFDEWFEAGKDVGALHYEINPADEKDILASVRNGKIYSDFMIVTIHAHQSTSFDSQGVGGVEHEPTDFLVKLAHDSVDNGADMFIAHGMHALHGIEIYKGKPVFYGLSNFVFQFSIQFGRGYDVFANEKGMSGFEAEPSQVSILTTTHFEHGKLTEIRLYPADLGGASRPISQVGIPLTPSPQKAQAILQALQDYSRPYGTKIVIENGVGVIRL